MVVNAEMEMYHVNHPGHQNDLIWNQSQKFQDSLPSKQKHYNG